MVAVAAMAVTGNRVRRVAHILNIMGRHPHLAGTVLILVEKGALLEQEVIQ